MIVTVLCKKTHKRSPNFKIPLTENSRKCKCSSIDGRHTGSTLERQKLELGRKALGESSGRPSGMVPILESSCWLHHMYKHTHTYTHTTHAHTKCIYAHINTLMHAYSHTYTHKNKYNKLPPSMKTPWRGFSLFTTESPVWRVHFGALHKLNRCLQTEWIGICGTSISLSLKCLC